MHCCIVSQTVLYCVVLKYICSWVGAVQCGAEYGTWWMERSLGTHTRTHTILFNIIFQEGSDMGEKEEEEEEVEGRDL